MNVFILAALTADGFIGRTADHLADWTSADDKKLFVRLTKEAGVIVMGSRTFATIGHALPGRRMIVYTSHPEKITATGVETTSERPKELIARLKSEGMNGIAVCGGAQIYTLFAQAGVVDELYLTISPLLFGAGIRLFGAQLDLRLKLLETGRLGDNELLLKYSISRDIV